MTTETKFTPGPWIVGDRFVYVLNDKGTNVFCAHVQDAHTDPAELQANAHLIAAAPELYEAAKRALNYIQNTESEMGAPLDSGDCLRAALAKARGEA